MNDYKKLKFPKEEKLEVQLLDGTDEYNIIYVISSLSKIRGKDIKKTFKLYSVSDDGSLTLIEKREDEPNFKTLDKEWSKIGE